MGTCSIPLLSVLWTVINCNKFVFLLRMPIVKSGRVRVMHNFGNISKYIERKYIVTFKHVKYKYLSQPFYRLHSLLITKYLLRLTVTF